VSKNRKSAHTKISGTIGISVLVSLLWSLSGCLVSNVQTERPFNALGRSAQLELAHDGYVIGIEKRERSKVNGPARHYSDRFQALPKDSPQTKTLNARFHDLTNDPNVMLVTHIGSFFENRRFLYNAYAAYGIEDTDYESGYEALELFQQDLANRLSTAQADGMPYTHILLTAMGWNSDQHKTIWWNNHILANMKKAAEANGETEHFRPLVIALTWPSVWKGISDSWFEQKVLGHVGSYFNKAADADEIGYTLANWVLHKQLPEIREAYEGEDFPVVVGIGHSFGARLLTRAMASKGHLKAGSRSQTRPLDLFIGLQGAFSANRFISGAGIEGSPYENFQEWGLPMVLSSSNHDLATPVAKYISGASHIGGMYGLQVAIEENEIFEVMKWEGSPSPQLQHDKILVVECDGILHGMDAHNDIIDMEMGKLIWTFTRLAKRQK